MENLYTVLGGSTPGVFNHSPFLVGGASAPVMPIVIKCTSEPEAKAALGLQPLFKKLGSETANERPEDFATALAESSQISDIFATQGPFYAVYLGKTQRAIYVRTFKPQVHEFMFAKFRRLESIKEALVYMVLKGNMQKMSAMGLGLPAPKTQSPEKSSKAKIIYSHIRDFTGITNTIYGSTSQAPTYASYGFGKHASYYLQAHGYDEDSIGTIETLWMASKDVDEFLKPLISRGMPATEVQWLWDLIHHDDNCGF
ncbi:hypothetical protein B0H17DRAFT_1150811 [Mycena rosella]|uniref:Uncharacterized protein n=1 Tax=Mycena rosella TaxID=1033263 RepID=A0AAD7BQY3_MYCRO|nr:hypothetical protein B0H17DRAFT_1150811 [Mycena rosella]